MEEEEEEEGAEAVLIPGGLVAGMSAWDGWGPKLANGTAVAVEEGVGLAPGEGLAATGPPGEVVGLLATGWLKQGEGLAVAGSVEGEMEKWPCPSTDQMRHSTRAHFPRHFYYDILHGNEKSKRVVNHSL